MKFSEFLVKCWLTFSVRRQEGHAQMFKGSLETQNQMFISSIMFTLKWYPIQYNRNAIDKYKIESEWKGPRKRKENKPKKKRKKERKKNNENKNNENKPKSINCLKKKKKQGKKPSTHLHWGRDHWSVPFDVGERLSEVFTTTFQSRKGFISCTWREYLKVSIDKSIFLRAGEIDNLSSKLIFLEWTHVGLIDLVQKRNEVRFVVLSF